jgi:hypothetical protein
MTLKLYLWGIRLVTLLAIGGWIAVVVYVDPDKSGALGQALFYFSLFLALSGLFILFSTWMKRKFSDPEKMPENLKISFRQGLLLALLAGLILILQNFRVLTWWDGLLAVAGVFLAELYFLSR